MQRIGLGNPISTAVLKRKMPTWECLLIGSVDIMKGLTNFHIRHIELFSMIFLAQRANLGRMLASY